MGWRFWLLVVRWPLFVGRCSFVELTFLSSAKGQIRDLYERLINNYQRTTTSPGEGRKFENEWRNLNKMFGK